MKKLMFASLALSAMVAWVPTVVLAETTSPTARPLMEARQELRQERRDEVLERIANRVENRFSRHQQRLTNWIERATKHIAQKEANGKDMTAAKKALETAKTSLATATQLGNDAVAKLRAVQPESWTEQKADAKAAREAVKKAQVAYAQVVKDMMTVLQELKKAE